MPGALAGRSAAQAQETAHPWFGRVAWGVLAYNILVVLWGAYVRATGSGDGCGNNWPLCQGVVVPRAPQAQTIIEFTHRLTVFFSFVALLGVCVWAFRLFPRGHRSRYFSVLSLVFFFVEALLGAGLVLLRYVAHDASAGRAVYLSAHLVNTQVLLAMLVFTAWFAGEPTRRTLKPAPRLIIAALPAALMVAVTGVLAALGDTLFPAASVASGIRTDFAGSADALLRLRAMHPLVAVAGGVCIIAGIVAARRQPKPAAVRAGTVAGALLLLQMAAGVVNFLLLAPVWMQILHLLIADLLWVVLVLMVLEVAPAVP